MMGDQNFPAIIIIPFLLLSSASCEAITTTTISTSLKESEISSAINTTPRSTSIIFSNNDTSPPDQIIVESMQEETGLNSTRRPRATGWVWGQDQSATSSSSRDAKPTPASARDIEPRGIYTWFDGSTTPVPTTTDGNCQCVPYYYCDEGEIISVIDLRHGWGCHSVLEVCCKKPRPTWVPPTWWPPHSSSTPPPTAQPGFTPQCGTLNPNGVNARILGFKDSETQFGEYPWMGALLESRSVRGKWVLQFVCGASLITPKVVLTAAHCVKGKRATSMVVRLGEWDTQSTNEFYPYQDRKVGDIVVHPKFYSGGLYNDIALIFLKTPATLAPHIDTVCLPRPNPQFDPGTCWATGWGKNAFGPKGKYQAILREVELAIIPQDVCQNALRETDLGSKFKLHNSFICAGGQKDLDTCIGDGGGPLVCPSLYDPWRYELVGITSWGVKCGSYGVPGVYTDVPKYRDWIDREILKKCPDYNPGRWTIPLPTEEKDDEKDEDGAGDERKSP